MLKSYGLVFLMGIAGIWKAIPIGFILKLNPVWIAVATVLGATVGIVLIYFLGTSVKQYIEGRMKKKQSTKAKTERFKKILDKYGAAGVGILGSLIFGPNLTMAMGLIIVKSGKKLLFWTFLGTIVWSALLTAIAAMGIDVLSNL